MQTIFVSSTFEDMHTERDILRDHVAPLINEEARLHGETVEFCDLRWGINTENMTEEESSRKVLEVCLAEIRRSTPPLVILLGDRYGWVPEEIQIRQAAASQQFPLEDCSRSVTALEIEYGAFFLKYPAFVYVKHAGGAVDPRIQALEERLGRLPNVTIRQYVLEQGYGQKRERWEEQQRQFAEGVREDLLGYFRRQWQKPRQENPLQRELEIHWRYLEEQNAQFRARTELARTLTEELEGERELVTVRGAEGMGKTTLLAHIACTMRDRGWDVLPLVAGLTAGSTDVQGILKTTLAFLQEQLGLEQEQGGFFWMRSRILTLSRQYAAAGRRMVVLVDGMERLQDSEDGMRLVCAGKAMKYFLTAGESFRFPDLQCHTLEPLSPGELRETALGILRYLGRELPEEVLDRFWYYGGTPLQISRAIHKLCQMKGSQIQKDYEHQDFLEHLKSSMQNQLDTPRFEQLESSGASDRVMDALTLSRTGLRLEDLAAIDGAHWDLTEFLRMVNRQSQEFIRTADGRIRFARKGLRRAKDKTVLLTYLAGLPEEDPIRKEEYLYQLACYGSDEQIREAVCGISESALSGRLVLEDGGKPICRLLSTAENGAFGCLVVRKLMTEQGRGERTTENICRCLRSLPVDGGGEEEYLLRILPAAAMLALPDRDDWKTLAEEILKKAEEKNVDPPDLLVEPLLSALEAAERREDPLARRLQTALAALLPENCDRPELVLLCSEQADSMEQVRGKLLERLRGEPEDLEELPSLIEAGARLLQRTGVSEDPEVLSQNLELGRSCLEKLDFLRLCTGIPTLQTRVRGALCLCNALNLLLEGSQTGEDHSLEVFRDISDAVEDYCLDLRMGDEVVNLPQLQVASDLLQYMHMASEREIQSLEQSMAILREEIEIRKDRKLKTAYDRFRRNFVQYLEGFPAYRQKAAAYQNDPRYTLVGRRGLPAISELPVRQILRAHSEAKKLTLVGKKDEKRVENAEKSYAPREKIGEIAALYDTSLLKNGKKGAAFGTLGMALSGVGAFRYDEVTRATLEADTLLLTLEDEEAVRFESDGPILHTLLNDLLDHML